MFNNWNWGTVNAIDKKIYTEQVQIFSVKGSLESALGWLCAFWHGPPGGAAQRMRGALLGAGAVAH